MGTALDVIGAIEAAYAHVDDDDEWLAQLLACVHGSFGASIAPTSAFSFSFAGGTFTMGAFACVGDPPFTREQFMLQQSVPPPHLLRKAFECDAFTRLSRVVGQRSTHDGLSKAQMKGADALGLRANLDHEQGVIVTTLVPAAFRLRDRMVWLRFASHVGAALRLRQRKKRVAPEAAAAILTPSGKLEHGTNATYAARTRLADAAKGIDRARGKLRRLDPDEASATWRTMVEGEWSLVDWFDHDGKRFLLAHDNRVVPSRATPKLSDREQQVVACAAMGHSNKLIAYDLGLSPGTVSVILARAAAKLGVTNRPALTRVFRELAEQS